MGSLNRPLDVLLRALASVKAAHITEGTSIFEVLIGDGGQVSSTTPCERASGSSADQLFEADSDHMVGEATCAWCRVESAARVHHGLVPSGNQVMSPQEQNCSKEQTAFPGDM
jgi:hypothetical protein